jgi:hypothetical protein
MRREGTLIDFTVKEVVLQCHAPYKVGDVFTEGEASVMNQTLRENMRNNFAEDVVEAKKEAEEAGVELDVAALQEKLDKYYDSYEFGVRSAGIRAADPVEAEALSILRNKIREHLRVKGVLKETSNAQISEMARQLLEKNPQIRDQARTIVAARESTSSEIQGL